MGLAVPERRAAVSAGRAATRVRALPDGLWDLFNIGLLGLLTLLFFWRIWTPKDADRGSFPPGDFYEQFYPFAVHRARELLAGEIPHWYPWAFGGAPFQADIQSAVFYPLSWPATLLFGPRGYPVIALELEAIAHIFLAGAFTYLLGRAFFGSRFAALLAAISYAFGGYLTSYPMQQLSILEVHTWLPLLILAVHRATAPGLATPRRLLFAVLGGLTLGLGILAGHPQAAMYLIYAASLYFALRTLTLPVFRRHLPTLGAAYLLLLAVGLGLAAIQWVPTYEFMKITSRAGIDYDFAWWGFPLRDLFQLVLPGVVSLMSPLYVGFISLTAALVAAFIQRSRETLFWGVFTVVALLISFGGHTFLYSPLYLAAPGFGTFRDHERVAVLVSFGLAVLAGHGADRFIAAASGAAWLGRLRRGLLWSAGGAGLFYLAATLTNRLAPGKVDDLLDKSSLLLLVAGLAATLVYSRERGLAARWLAPALLAVAVLDLFTASWLVNFDQTPPGERFPALAATEYLQAHRDEGRTYNEHRLFLNYGAVYQIQDANGASPLLNARYKRLLENEPKERFWDLLNVRYLLTWRPDYGGGPKILSEKIRRDEDIHLFERSTALPRAWLVYDYEVMTADDRAFDRVVSPEFDPRRSAVLSADPGAALSPAATGQVTGLETQSNGSLQATVSSDGPGLLVLSEVFTPGWQATIDGRPVEVRRADYVLRAVLIPAGTHEVRLFYVPPGFRTGAIITVFTLGLALAAVAGLMVADRRSRKSKQGVDTADRL